LFYRTFILRGYIACQIFKQRNAYDDMFVVGCLVGYLTVIFV